MADLTVTEAQLRPIESIEARLIPMIANEAIAKGKPVYRHTNGNGAVARGNAVGTSKLVGIATTTVPAGTAFDALHYGRLAGYDLSGVNPGVTIYLSITAGGLLADAAAAGTGNVVVAVGTVHVMTDGAQTKFLFVDIPQNAPVPTAI